MSKIILLRKFPISGGGGGGVPTLSSMTPTTTFTDVIAQTITGVALTGTNMGGSSPQVNVPTGWSTTNLVVVGTTSATFDLTIPANRPAGTYNLNFQTVDGTSNVLTFTIQDLVMGGTFLSKIAASGVVTGISFDSTSNIFAPGLGLPTQPMTYAWLAGGACDGANPGGLGNGSITFNRLAGERVALATDINGTCFYPQIDTSIYHAAGGGTGALKLTIPSQSGAGTGGYVWLPYKGLGTAFELGPDHANGGIIYLQWYQRWSDTYITGILESGEPSFTGTKQAINFGNPPNGNDSSYFEVTAIISCPSGLFSMYGQQGADDYAVVQGSTIYLQSATTCAYGSGSTYGTFPSPPCIVVQGSRWYECSYAIQFRPVAADFSVSGSTLSRAATFDASMVGKDVYIVGDGFHRITAFINSGSVTLGSSPIAGSGKAVYIANYPNCRVRSWIDGVPCMDTFTAKVWWGNGGSGDGFGSFKFQAHMTGKNPAIAHAEAYTWIDDVVVSTEPISMIPTGTLAQFAAGMAPSTWAAFNTVNMTATFTNTGGASNIITPYAMEMVWDNVLKRAHFIGGDHGVFTNQGFRHVYLDTLTNTWTNLGNPPWYTFIPYNDAHGYHLTALNSVGRKLYRLSYGGVVVHVFDLDLGTWITDLPVIPEGQYIVAAMTFFPERNSLIVASASGTVWSFNVSGSTWSDITPGGGTGLPSTWQWANYNATRQEVQIGSSTNKLWRYSSAGSWTQLTDIGATYRSYDGSGFNGLWLADNPSGKYLLVTDTTNGTGRNVYEYNASSQAFTLLTNQLPDKHLNGNWTALTIPEYGVTMWCWAVGGGGGSAGIYLYKHTG